MSITPELKQWQILHGVSDAAVAHLMMMFGADHPDPHATKAEPASETANQNDIRLGAAKSGWALWRNNVGVLQDDRGVPVRYGLANDTKAMNKNIKSSDLIGVRPVLIEPHHVGTTIGQFVAIEVKKTPWTYTGKGREKAQMKFHEIVRSHGGYAKFANSVDMALK